MNVREIIKKKLMECRPNIDVTLIIQMSKVYNLAKISQKNFSYEHSYCKASKNVTFWENNDQ